LAFARGGRMSYQIWNVGTLRPYKLKSYPFKLQAYIWCWLNGYVYKAGRLGYILDERVEIWKVEE